MVVTSRVVHVAQVVGAVVAVGLGAGGCGDNHVSTDAALPRDSATHLDAATLVGNYVYLDFGGGDIKMGPTDAPDLDVSSIALYEGVLAPWHDGLGDQASSEASIVAALEEQLSAFPFHIVTTQPAGEPYDHVVFGGKASTLFGGGVTTDLELLSAGPIDCTAHRPHVMFIFDDAWPSAAAIGNSITGMIGLANGIPPSQTSGDCMCISDAACSISVGACTFATNATVGSDGNQCATGATFDDLDAFLMTFGE